MQTILTLELSEHELAFAIRDGDELAFEKIFRRYYNRLCNYANTILLNADEAEEMVQATFLSMWENRLRIDIHTSIKSYLYRAVHNHCLNALKHKKVKQQHRTYYEYHAETSHESTSQQLLTDEMQQQLNKAIEAMPNQCRSVFLLSRFENFTYAEIAAQLNISIKTVDKHMVKALKILREKLKDYLPLLLFLLMCKN